jgi:hypothetical protein
MCRRNHQGGVQGRESERVRIFVLGLGFFFAAATGVFYWASGVSSGFGMSLCRAAPALCNDWQVLAYAAGITLVGYAAVEILSR